MAHVMQYPISNSHILDIRHELMWFIMISMNS